MTILVVAATPAEMAPVAAALGVATPRENGMNRYRCGAHTVDALTTGVGMVATAARCARILAQTRYGFALNIGVCGSFDRALAPGAVVHIVSDRIAELGAEDGDRFLTIQDMHLLGDDEPPFTGGALVNAVPPSNAALARLPAVRAITVNTVHGNAQSIDAVLRRFRPQVESMEGAAFMYACLMQGVPFAQVRAVSNAVEPRNRSAWKITEAIQHLSGTALTILETL
ncbi:MAG TPA: futalosine hydrolase [Vicinamibacterales bacterium]|jgi:futalosine hydrolase|nr:futalosine hydrolase [Vicinamibacterales bacterium]